MSRKKTWNLKSSLAPWSFGLIRFKGSNPDLCLVSRLPEPVSHPGVFIINIYREVEGGIAQRFAHWLPVSAAPGSILSIPNNFKLDLIDFAVIKWQQRQCHESLIVIRNHPVLVRAVLQTKTFTERLWALIPKVKAKSKVRYYLLTNN